VRLYKAAWSACPGLCELGAAGVLTASIRLLEDLLPNCETCTMTVTPCKLQVQDPNAQVFLELALVAGASVQVSHHNPPCPSAQCPLPRARPNT
jgi:hypothetical protein